MDEKEEQRKEDEEKKDKVTGGVLKVSRRDFLKGMATSAVAATVTALPIAPLPEAEAAVPAGIKEAVVQLNVNDKLYRVKVRSHWTLLDVLRRELSLTGTKKACDHGNCGACTVIVDGKAVNACLMLASQADGCELLTIEGLATQERLHPIQQAFEDHAALQCGFCGPGVIMSAKALLDENLEPTPQEIRDALSGNLCRCTGYTKMIEATQEAARTLRDQSADRAVARIGKE